MLLKDNSDVQGKFPIGTMKYYHILIQMATRGLQQLNININILAYLAFEQTSDAVIFPEKTQVS